MAEISEEFVLSVVEEIKELAAANYCEAGFERILGNMDLDIDTFAMLQRKGNLRFYSFRKEGRLIGYSFYLITKSLIGKNVTAENGAFYLVPEERKGFTAYNLLREVEGKLRETGVNLLIHRTRTKQDLSAFFVRAGFELTEKVYTKTIGG